MVDDEFIPFDDLTDVQRQAVTTEPVRVWLSQLDHRTTLICQDVHGQVAFGRGVFYTLAGAFESPPAHVGCRSTVDFRLVPEVAFERPGTRFVPDLRRSGLKDLRARAEKLGPEGMRKEIIRSLKATKQMREVSGRVTGKVAEFVRSKRPVPLNKARERIAEQSPAKFSAKRHQEWYDDAARQEKLRNLATSVGYDDVEKFVDDVVEAWRGWLSEAKVAIRVPSTKLNNVLSSGRFKSQFETRTSKGLYDPEKRAGAESQMFGYANDLAPEVRPIYGFMDDGIDGLEKQYGDIKIIFKDEVRARTTFTVGDSLDNFKWGDLAVSPVDNPLPASLPVTDFAWSGDTTRLGRLFDPSLDRGGMYTEAQIHGGVGVTDIDTVIFGAEPDARYLALQAKLDKLGIRWLIAPS